MTNQNAIDIISRQLSVPNSVEKAEQDVLAKIMHKYPYFLPTRYIKASQQYKEQGFSPELLAGVYSYSGNWLQLWNFVQGIENDTPEQAVENKITEEFADDFEAGFESIVSVISIDEEILDETTTDNEVEDLAVSNDYSTFSISDTFKDDILATTDDSENEIVAREELAEETAIESFITSDENETATNDDNNTVFSPVSSEDYFMQQGIKISGEMPEQVEDLLPPVIDARDKSLMVMMSFTEWLLHFKHKSDKHKAEVEDQRAVKTMWQKEKLAAALQEENEEIPENVFEMAVNSITREEGLASESLADIYIKQQKYDKAIEMYRKLSLRNPQKNAYFARKIEEILKEKQL